MVQYSQESLPLLRFPTPLITAPLSRPMPHTTLVNCTPDLRPYSITSQILFRLCRLNRTRSDPGDGTVPR